MKRTISTSLIALVPMAFAACGGGGGGGASEDCTPGAGGNTAKYVTATVTVPTSRTDYSIDLNGDGRQDNQLGNIIGALIGQNLDVQMGVNDAVNSGQLVILVTENSADATFTADTCASSSLALGSLPAGTTKPDYSGMGSFTSNGSAGGTFAGPIKSGQFSSASPVTTKTPVSVTIKLPLIAGAKPITLDVQGAHIQYGKDSSGVIKGQIHGVIPNTKVQSTIVPNVASLLTTKINDPAGGSTSSTIAGIFDTCGAAQPGDNCGTCCANPDKSCAVKGEKKIDSCEVATSGIIKNVLSPDVQMFAADGTTWSPNADNKNKDSLSLGIAFTLAGAKF